MYLDLAPAAFSEAYESVPPRRSLTPCHQLTVVIVSLLRQVGVPRIGHLRRTRHVPTGTKCQLPYSPTAVHVTYFSGRSSGSALACFSLLSPPFGTHYGFLDKSRFQHFQRTIHIRSGGARCKCLRTALFRYVACPTRTAQMLSYMQCVAFCVDAGAVREHAAGVRGGTCRPCPLTPC